MIDIVHVVFYKEVLQGVQSIHDENGRKIQDGHHIQDGPIETDIVK